MCDDCCYDAEDDDCYDYDFDDRVHRSILVTDEFLVSVKCFSC